MAAETIRIKDIPTTATTAAADDYVVIDGATNKVRKGLASNLITPASHNADPAAHPLLVNLAPKLRKSNPDAPLFLASGQTIATAQSCYAQVVGIIVAIPAATSVTLPTLTAGTDYAIYLLANGTLLASADFTAPAGYTTANTSRIGGAHYAPGGNAAARAGGDATPQFNPYSAWDLNFRPRCADPRGMAFVIDGWLDIYLANTTPDLLGTSAYNAAIADGATLPKLPAFWGGNGTTAMDSFSLWEASRYFEAFGKHLPRFLQLANACYGVTEGTSIGPEPTVTALDNLRTSKFGLLQATGSMWCWTDAPISGGFGVHGGFWAFEGDSSSRANAWYNTPTDSYSYIGARGAADHLIVG